MQLVVGIAVRLSMQVTETRLAVGVGVWRCIISINPVDKMAVVDSCCRHFGLCLFQLKHTRLPKRMGELTKTRTWNKGRVYTL